MSYTIDNDAGSLFFELAGDLRLSMLLKISNNRYRLSQLANDLHATMQEAHRNITRLIDAGLVAKDTEGDIFLTPYGKIIVTLIPSFDFLFSNKEYFLDHSIGDIPLKFVQRIGSFQSCEKVYGVMAILQRWKSLYLNSDTYIKEIMSQVPLDLIETVGDRVKKGIRFSYIFASNSIIPKGRSEILQRIGWKNFIVNGLVERKMLESVKVMIILNEKEGCVLFPNLKGEPDLNTMFYGKNPAFLDWCNDYYQYMWKIASSFDEAKLKAEI